MHCPFCGCVDQRVLDSRIARDGAAIRRRRECSVCGRRFTTFEEPEMRKLFVIKRDGSREPFSSEKILRSMMLACRKRTVASDTLLKLAHKIELELLHQFEMEAPSLSIGEIVLRELYTVDIVGYVRFASVYREFETLEDFEEIIETERTAERNKRQPDFV